MRNYENKTKEDLLEIIEQLEEKIDFLSSHSSDSSSPSKERFRDKYSTRILDALPDMLTYPNKEISLRKNNRSIMGYIRFWKTKMEIYGWGLKKSDFSNLKRQEQIITLFTILNTRQMILIV